MARKRLSGPQPDYLMLDTKAATGLSGPLPDPVPASRPPIAQIASETAALAAFEEVSEELRSARDEGRMVLRIALRDVSINYLIRDRIDREPEAMDSLTESIRLRGQQTPIEVVDRGPEAEATGRYGLISGWRRMMALDALSRRGMPQFSQVLALVRRPTSDTDAYISMVEENEIRAGLSFYERARIVLRVVETGIFPNEKTALQALFANASYAKRSKVKSFFPLVLGLDKFLRFPSRISERTGLALSQMIEADPGIVREIYQALTEADPTSAEAEGNTLDRFLRQSEAKAKAAARDAELRAGSQSGGPETKPGLTVKGGVGMITLSGTDVTEDFIDRLHMWLLSVK